MNDNEFYKDEGTGAETPRGASVEYGPYDYNPYYGHKRKGRGGRIAAIVLAAFLLLGIGVALGKILTPNVGNGLGDGHFPIGGGEGQSGASAPEYGGNVIVRVTDENAVIQNGSVASVVQKCDASVVEIMTKSVSVGNTSTGGAGSGVIFGVDKDKGYTYIVTNNHVIESATTIRVRTVDGTEYDAALMGTDWRSDIAVLQIKATGLKPATLGKSASLVKGQDVAVIGNPFGSLGGSVTSGVLSGLGREITIEGVPMSLLQVDAAINPGNSGGGLFDMNGNLIGVVNAKSYGEVVDDIGFAIPIDEAQAICEELLKKGYVSARADLGFVFTEYSGGIVVKSYAYNEETGNQVAAGDILYAITLPSGERIVIEGIEDYKTALAKLSVGDKVTLTMYRVKSNGFLPFSEYDDYTLTVTVKEYRPRG